MYPFCSIISFILISTDPVDIIRLICGILLLLSRVAVTLFRIFFGVFFSSVKFSYNISGGFKFGF